VNPDAKAIIIALFILVLPFNKVVVFVEREYIMQSYLQHHGIKGMHWGVRKYQNKDGSLTSEGKKHKQNYKTHKDNYDRVKDAGTKIVKSSKKMQDAVGEYDYYNMAYTNSDYRQIVSPEKSWFSKTAKSAKVDKKKEIVSRIDKQKTLVFL
jgi:hypothetical protein